MLEESRCGREQSRRQQLRSLLQTARSRLTRDAVGLPQPYGRCRDEGLRQEDVAELIGKSVRWYASFERGEIPLPGVQMIQRIADVLHMEGGKRSAFYLLAAGHTPPPLAPADTVLEPVLRSLVAAQGPNPTMVTDCAWNVLLWNEGITDWFLDLSALAPEDRNIVIWLFFHDLAPERVGGIEEERREMLGRFRAWYCRYPGEPRIEAVLNRLLKHPEAAKLWETVGPREDPVVQFRTIHHPLHGPVDIPLITADLPRGMRLVTFLPPWHKLPRSLLDRHNRAAGDVSAVRCNESTPVHVNRPPAERN
ncbi:helix-turn-helix domain-containing protein [Streptomyces sp. NPDC050315]|uniref:MmyB family transcriptional regulator n=1 Tax=Streptomyces sp. NPDC050315 TaxID=3155039 RepID=UPI003430C10F